MARNDIDLTTVAKAIADPSRASMLLRLMDGQAHTAGSLATAAGTSASATTAHLHHLRDAGLVEVEAAGRQRLHRLSSAAVAHAIEALAEISPLLPEPVTNHPVRRGIKTKLRYARTCYSHLGGALGVRLTEVLQRDGVIDLAEATMLRTVLDHPLLARLGIINLAPGASPAVRSCLDWTERKPHLAGRLGTHLLTAMINHEWLRRSPNDRSVSITAAGRAALSSLDALPEFHPQAS